MNLLLLLDDDFLEPATARLTGRRLLHAREVLRATQGERLRVGQLNGRIGEGEITSDQPDELRLSITWSAEPPARPGRDLLLAIPRPKALKKLLPAVASLGIDRVVLLNAARVEKSYFDSKVLAPESIRDLLLQGLEQARDTRLPEVFIRPRFRPFVEDDLDGLLGTHAKRLLAHPVANASITDVAAGVDQRVVLAVGPEGGWVPFELELLTARGFTLFHAGPRTLRVEVAVPFLLGALCRP